MNQPQPFRTSRTSKPWGLMIPARLTISGKRAVRYFATQAQASAFASALRQAAESCGTASMALSPAALTDADAARKLLQAHLPGVTLLQAARMAIQAATSGTSPNIAAEGAGGGENPGTAHDSALTLPAALAAYTAARGHQSARTTAARASNLSTLMRRNPGLDRIPLNMLSSSDLQHALETAWPTQAAAYNDALKHLSTLYTWYSRKGIITSNPITAIDKRHAKEAEIRALTPQELIRLFRACRPALPREITAHGNTHQARMQHADTTALTLYVALGAFAGIRPEEIKRLRWQDIDLEDSVISIRAQNAKTGGTRHIELHPTLRAWLTAHRPDRATAQDLIIPPTALAAKEKALRIRAGYGPHNPWPQDALRHSYATHYLKNGGNLHQLQLNMGHRDSHLLYTRYTNMVGCTRATAAAWWALTPAAVADAPE